MDIVPRGGGGGTSDIPAIPVAINLLDTSTNSVFFGHQISCTERNERWTIPKTMDSQSSVDADI